MDIIQEKAISSVKGKAIPKPANDQNTDDIIPARYLKEITFAKMGEYAYFDERFKNEKRVESHPFNDPKYVGANILITGSNYGCGSSREHAPQALHRFGINAIIAESFAEIFAGNCASLGVVGVTVSAKDIVDLLNAVKQNPQTLFEINLNAKTVSYNGRSANFEMPEGRRQAFLNGTWDALAVLQQNESSIKKTESRLVYLKYK